MKYYLVCKKEVAKDNKARGRHEYECFTLCRYDNNKCEVYEMGEHKACGEWTKNDELLNVLKNKDKNYFIKEADKGDIEACKMYIDDLSYDDYHTSFSGLKDDDAPKDRKGKKHSEYIYQDYRSVDGYEADGRFEYDEIIDREYFEYYMSNDDKTLYKKDIDSNEWFKFVVEQKNDDASKKWIKIKEINIRDLKKVKEFKEVLDYCNNCANKLSKSIENKEKVKKNKMGIAFWMKWSNYKSLWGLLIGLIGAIVLYVFIKNIWISILGFLIISFVSMIIIQKKGINDYAEEYIDYNKKCQSINPEEIRGRVSEKLDELLDLDKELLDFFNKYSSGKEPDYYEKELNKQWSIHGEDFVRRAKSIISEMNNQELMYSLLSTEMIPQIVDVFDYFTPFTMDLEYLKEHPDKAKEYYYENLMQIHAIEHNSINEHYFKKLMDLNCFEEIEKTILSCMSNEELMELANSSKDWREKLYFYGFIKKEQYYIYKNEDGSNGTIVKFSNGLFYKYENGKWVENASLIKIFFEITDYEEVSKEEAEKAIKEEMKKKKK